MTYTLAILLLAGLPPEAIEFTFHHENVLGTSLELRVRAIDFTHAQHAESQVLDTIDRLAATLSSYDPTTEFSRWLQSSDQKTPQVLSPPLFNLLAEAESYRLQTKSAFDPRAAAFSHLWKTCQTQNRLPTPAELSHTLQQLDSPAYTLDTATHAATRLTPCPLSLDAIAKGHIVEAAAHAAATLPGVQGLLLNIGGDLHATGPFSWSITLAPPRGDSESAPPFTAIPLKNASLATSGASQRPFRIAGRTYSHILDPRTGQPAAEILQAHVIAPSGTQADALATAFNLLEPANSLALADSLPGVACLLLTREGRILKSAAWPDQAPEIQVAFSTQPPPVQNPPPIASWSDQFDFTVNFELNRPSDTPGGRYRRPYVVLWVENDKGLLVRTLVVWISLGGSGPDQWLPDLSRWYRGDTKQNSFDRKSQAYAIARPTRPPGQYSARWDGKDDKGQPLPPGSYTIFLEAAREHGTHQLMRQPVQVGGTDEFTHQLPGGTEIQSATIEYRKKENSQ